MNTENLSREQIIDNIEKTKNFRICTEKLTNQCIDVGDHKLFRYNVCINCYNTKQLIRKREKNGKFYIPDLNSLDNDKVYKLAKMLTPLQVLKLTGMLTLDQQKEFKKILENNNISDFQQINNTSDSSEISNTQSLSQPKKPILKLVTSH